MSFNAIQTDPVVYQNNIFFAGRSCNLYFLDAMTGTKNWMFHDPASMWLLGGPAIYDNLLYLGSSNQHFIQAFDVNAKTKKWTVNVDYRIFGTPLVDGEFVFFGTGNEKHEKLGSLYAIDRLSGKIENRIMFPGQIHSSLVLENATIYFGCSDGNVYAVDRQKLPDTPHPVTTFKQTGSIELGELQQNAVPFEAVIFIHNLGDGPDTLTISCSTSGATSNNVYIQPKQYQIAANDSLAIHLNINTAAIHLRSFMTNIKVVSKYNIDVRTINQSVVFKVVTASGVYPESGTGSAEFSLNQNYPNPFNPETILHYSLPADARIEMDIYNCVGQKIRTLASWYAVAGEHRVLWNGTDDWNCDAASGIYLCCLRMISNDHVRMQTTKMSLLR